MRRKAMVRLARTLVFLGTIVSLLGVTPSVGAVVVYDNTTTAEGPALSGSGAAPELGDQVTLAGTARLVTDLLFGYATEATGVTARVRFYANDGLGGAPNTVLFDSGSFVLTPGVNVDKSFSGISVPVPDTFTWAVAYSIPPGAAFGFGLLEYDPPTVGSSDDFVWNKVGGNWFQANFPNSVENLKASITAVSAPVPEPATLLLLATGLAGWGATTWRRHRRM
jgi:hypothetical protein